MDSRIIERIQKLMELGNSPNQNEAEAAIAKAQSLLAQHNLTAGDLRDDELGEILEETFVDGKIRKWKRSLITGLAQAHGCIILIGYHPTKIRSYKIVGREANIATVMWMWEYLSEVIEKKTAQAFDFSLNPPPHRDSFRYGMASSLISRLEKRTHDAAVNGEAGIIPVDEVNAFLTQKYGQLTNEKSKIGYHPGSAKAGYDKAQNIGLDTQVGGERSGVLGIE